MKKHKMSKENKRGIYGTICVCIIILFVYMMKIHNNEIWRLLGDTLLIIGLVYCVIQLFIDGILKNIKEYIENRKNDGEGCME